MDDLQRIQNYFPNLSRKQVKQFGALQGEYTTWNAKINLISRKDIHNLYVRHVLHSLTIGLIVRFNNNADILDVGTGGGFPGIPLAVLFPKTNFVLVDSIQKKAEAVKNIAAQLDLHNVKVLCKRAEESPGNYDFVLGRAVKSISTLYRWVHKKLKKKHAHCLPNGILYLQGAMDEESIARLPKSTSYHAYPIKYVVKEPFFRTKYMIHMFPKGKLKSLPCILD